MCVQIQVSLSDVRLQSSALQLFRRVLLLKHKDETLKSFGLASQVYQCVDRVAELLVQTHDKSVAAVCSKIYVEFVLTFPMSNKVQSFRVNHLIKSLSYPQPQGRQNVLNALHALLVSQPDAHQTTQD